MQAYQGLNDINVFCDEKNDKDDSLYEHDAPFGDYTSWAVSCIDGLDIFCEDIPLSSSLVEAAGKLCYSQLVDPSSYAGSGFENSTIESKRYPNYDWICSRGTGTAQFSVYFTYYCLTNFPSLNPTVSPTSIPSEVPTWMLTWMLLSPTHVPTTDPVLTSTVVTTGTTVSISDQSENNAFETNFVTLMIVFGVVALLLAVLCIFMLCKVVGFKQEKQKIKNIIVEANPRAVDIRVKNDIEIGNTNHTNHNDNINTSDKNEDDKKDEEQKGEELEIKYETNFDTDMTPADNSSGKFTTRSIGDGIGNTSSGDLMMKKNLNSNKNEHVQIRKYSRKNDKLALWNRLKDLMHMKHMSMHMLIMIISILLVIGKIGINIK